VAGLEADQVVLADPTGVPLADHIRLGGQRAQRRPVALGPDGDHLAVGAVHLGTPEGQPGDEGGIQLTKRGRTHGR
jgi:hypothetical protein